MPDQVGHDARKNGVDHYNKTYVARIESVFLDAIRARHGFIFSARKKNKRKAEQTIAGSFMFFIYATAINIPTIPKI